jgi:hypothetical protein
MPEDLRKIIETLYAIILGFGFSDVVNSKDFKLLLLGKFDIPQLINSLSLFLASMIFLMADFLAYMWLSKNAATTEVLYSGTKGSFMFLIDLILVSIHYFLISISTKGTSINGINFYMVLLLTWHFLVILWYLINGSRSNSLSFSLIPSAHLIRLSIYLLFFIIIKFINFLGSRKRRIKYWFQFYIIILSFIISIFSFNRFIYFHNRIFQQKATSNSFPVDKLRK